MNMTRREVLGGIAVLTTEFVIGCRTVTGAGAFSFTVINPECLGGGAGLCVVVRTPSGKTYLFDTGNGTPENERNNGRDIIAPWLRAHGISVIDGLIISHYHSDHFGGFLWLAKNFPIRRVFNNAYLPEVAGLTEKDLREYRAAREALDAYAAANPGCLVEGLKFGDDLGWDEPDVAFDVVWPPKEGPVKPLENRKGFVPGDTIFHHLLNGNSNALRVTAFGKVFFIVGDIQPDYAAAYMKPYLEPKGLWGCDVAVLPAHGTNSDQALPVMKTMAPCPKVAIASLGNHPWMMDCAKAVKRIYADSGIVPFATNVDGDLAFGPSAEPMPEHPPKTYPFDPK